MQLTHAADAVAAGAVHWDDGLAGNLEFVTDINDAGIDRSGGPLIAAIKIAGFGGEVAFDERNEAVDEVGQPNILNGGFEIGHAVLNRGAPNDGLGIERGIPVFNCR